MSKPKQGTLYLGDVTKIKATDLAKMVEELNGHVTSPEELAEAQADLDSMQIEIAQYRKEHPERFPN
jgi:hypothetical protein